MASDIRATRAWRKLRDRVVREEPFCWLKFESICTRLSTTADHVIPVSQRPDLGMVRSNHRGACSACNRARNRTPLASLNLDKAPAALSVFG